MIDTAPVLWFDEIDSTSSEARRRAEAGQLDPVWIVGRRQSAGRGRLGRPWVSTTGNLYTTVLFALNGGAKDAIRLPFAAGLAVQKTCQRLVDACDVQLKWPNDVRIGGAKLSGILVESGVVQHQHWVAIGIGVNVSEAPDMPDRATTCLLNHMRHPMLTPEAVLDDLRPNLAAIIQDAERDFPTLLQRWLAHAEGIGSVIRAGPINRQSQGVFTGLADDGGLILRLPDGTEQIIRAGEIELVKQVS